MTCGHCHAEFPAGSAFCPDCGTSTAPGRAAAPVLVGYTILRPLGQGGAAVVYLAQQESLDRQVAVKVLRHDVEEPKVWRNFRREARTIALLSGHPNVVTVYTAGRSQGGQPYLVNEFLDRGSLGDVLAAEGPLAPAVVAKFGIAIADALVAAHGLGILHRDVKPANVLLGHDGRVKLGDFGIARLLAAQSVTATDVIAFTPEHVAPEILRGEPDGPWSDLYGLASTLANALVGAPLFARRPDERVDALLARKLVAPPPELPPSVPGELAGVVTRALDPDPSRRPSLPEFRRQLAAAAGALGAVVPLPPPVAAPTVSAAVPTDLQSGHDEPDEPDEPLIGALGRVRGRVLAIPALLIALLATLAVALLANGDGDRGDASSVTTNNVVTPTSNGSAAAPSSAPSAPASRAPETSAAVTSTTPAAVVPPTTVPPVVTSASSSAAPRTDPVTAVTPTTTTAPTTTAAAPTSPPPTPPPAAGPVALTTAPEAEVFLRSYYDAVAVGDYATSWAQLAPEFQRGKALSYDYYVEFWNETDVEVGDVALVDADQDRAIVNVELRYNASTTAVIEQFTLRPGEGGALLIASQS